MEFAGEVDAVGPLVSKWKPGQRVMGLVGGGAQAEYLVTHEGLLVEIPDNLDFIQAGGIPEVRRPELVADIHDRMPLILAPTDYVRWLSDEYDPRDLMRPFPAEPMRMWPISTRVNKPENDDPSIVEPIKVSAA